jgi:hypothetical protein
MSISKNFVVLMTIAAGTLVTNYVHAAALYSTTATPNRDDYGQYVGIGFVPTSNLLVTALGFIDDDGDGNAVSHPVELWLQTSPTTGTLLASATVQTGTASTLTNGFRYETVTSTPLLAGQTYVLVGKPSVSSGDVWVNAGSGGYTFGLPVSAFDARVGGASPGTFPSAVIFTSNFYQAPNLIATAVPEPTGMTLVLFGIAGLWRIARKRS